MRKRNVDILRDLAILIIIVYHAYVLCGTPWEARRGVHTLLSFGGELGVTLFFALSGFGIYLSLQRKKDTNGLPFWFSFMKSRCKRIMPQYYFCIFFLLLFQSAHLLSSAGIKHIGAYILFIQNLFVDTHGSINGALWTMATIFQFYIVAIWLYKAVNKNTVASILAAIAVTVLSKYLIYVYLIPAYELGGSAYFVYGRQLVSALDNFVLGMAAAKIVSGDWMNNKSKMYLYGMGVFLTVVSCGLLVAVSYYLSSNGLYGNSVRGYAGHTVLAILFAMLIVGVSMLPQVKGKLADGIQFLAKYQYGIYLWHMPIIISLYNGAPAFQYLALHNFSVFAIMLIIVIIVVGYITSKGIDAVFAGKK